MQNQKTLQNHGFLFLFLVAAGCSAPPWQREASQNEDSGSQRELSQKESAALAAANREKEEQFHALQEQLKRLEGKTSNITAQNQVASGDFFLPKDMLQEDFLWGSAVQIAVAVDQETANKDEQKSYVLGNRVVFFKRVGQRLQLVSREDLTTESDFASEKVIGSFLITQEDANSLGLKAQDFGTQSAELAGIVAPHSALRSLQFDENDGVLMLEITFNQGGGNYTNVLESIIPRKKVTNGKPGLQVLPAEPVASTLPSEIGFNGLLARLGTFPSVVWTPPAEPSTGDDLSNITKTEKTFVTRYNISDGRTIDWWVTSNIPDTLLPEIKAGVEGWNRYFNLFRAEKPVMRFMGKLPESARIGDPRLNIILFDAVSDAPSAYESQAVDPMTGYQSHSLIYLPFAWYNISSRRYLDGADSFSQGAAQSQSLETTRNKAGQMPSSRRIKCQRPVFYQDIPFLVKSRAAGSLDEAGRALVRSTLLHEVGHALGMDHNFKGTLSGDISQYNETNWVYSTSTMDYNPFAMEDTLFVEPGNPARDVTLGLVQPYDRQFIDIVYNDGAGTIAREEQAFAFCNDADHDDTTNGVDPLCRQYDFFASPNQTLTVALQRLQSPEPYLNQSLGGLITLSGFLADERDAILAELQREAVQPNAGNASASVTPKQAQEALEIFTDAAASGFNHFLRSGSYSVVNALTRDARLLGEWKPVDGMRKDTELSFLSGLQSLAEYITALFDRDGKISGDAYSTFERATQQTLSKQMAGIFQAQLNSEENQNQAWNAPFKASASDETGSFTQAAQAVLKMQQDMAQTLRTFIASNQSSHSQEFEQAVLAQSTQLQNKLQDSLTSAAVRIISELGSITVKGAFNAEIVSDRPQIRPEFTHELYAPLASIVMRTQARVADRASALPWLAVFDANSKRFGANLQGKDPETGKYLAASALREKVRRKLLAQLDREQRPLADKIEQGRYLTAAERERSEFLKDALKIVQDDPNLQ